MSDLNFIRKLKLNLLSKVNDITILKEQLSNKCINSNLIIKKNFVILDDKINKFQDIINYYNEKKNINIVNFSFKETKKEYLIFFDNLDELYNELYSKLEILLSKYNNNYLVLQILNGNINLKYLINIFLLNNYEKYKDYSFDLLYKFIFSNLFESINLYFLVPSLSLEKQFSDYCKNMSNLENINMNLTIELDLLFTFLKKHKIETKEIYEKEYQELLNNEKIDIILEKSEKYTDYQKEILKLKQDKCNISNKINISNVKVNKNYLLIDLLQNKINDIDKNKLNGRIFKIKNIYACNKFTKNNISKIKTEIKLLLHEKKNILEKLNIIIKNINNTNKKIDKINYELGDLNKNSKDKNNLLNNRYSVRIKDKNLELKSCILQKNKLDIKLKVNEFHNSKIHEKIKNLELNLINEEENYNNLIKKYEIKIDKINKNKKNFYSYLKKQILQIKDNIKNIEYDLNLLEKQKEEVIQKLDNKNNEFKSFLELLKEDNLYVLFNKYLLLKDINLKFNKIDEIKNKIGKINLDIKNLKEIKIKIINESFEKINYNEFKKKIIFKNKNNNLENLVVKNFLDYFDEEYKNIFVINFYFKQLYYLECVNKNYNLNYDLNQLENLIIHRENKENFTKFLEKDILLTKKKYIKDYEITIKYKKEYISLINLENKYKILIDKVKDIYNFINKYL